MFLPSDEWLTIKTTTHHTYVPCVYIRLTYDISPNCMLSVARVSQPLIVIGRLSPSVSLSSSLSLSLSISEACARPLWVVFRRTVSF